MAAVVQSKSQTTGSGSSFNLTFDSATTTGNSLIVLVFGYGTTDIGTAHVTDNKSNTFTRNLVEGNGTIEDKTAVFSCQSPTMGASHQITVAALSVAVSMVCLEVSGLAASAFDTSASGGP